MRKIPIFIISCNRLKVLQEAISSYEKYIETPFEIVIHDNNSTYRPLLKYLMNLEKKDVLVYYNKESALSEDQLNSVTFSIEHWFREQDAPYYVVTDPDVVLQEGCGDILELYAYLLDSRNEIEVVGPMLRIDDIPDYYPLKKEAVSRHYQQFWHKVPLTLTWEGKTIQYQRALIDTTFGMYRSGFKFHRLCQGYRTYAPYWAKHLDWYINPQKLNEDQIYYMEHASVISHWGGTWLREEMCKKKNTYLFKCTEFIRNYINKNMNKY